MRKSAWLIFHGALLVFWGLFGTVLGMRNPQASPTFIEFVASSVGTSLMFSGGLMLLVTGIVQSVKE